ncbi:MAG: prenyltransferase/squalene oxidase repeat-containing protein [Actinomycetota bacterium]
MKRLHLFAAALALLASTASAAPLTKDERQASIDFVLGLHNEDEGFRGEGERGPSSLGATNACLRALKYLGGKAPGVGRFVYVCTDPSGGFVDMPNTAPTVRTSAMGLMVAAETKNTLAKDGSYSIRDYFEKNTQSLPDIYIAAAALHAAELKVKTTADWIKAFEATANPDGTYGKSAADNAGAAITILRLGGMLKNAAAVAQSLKAAQKADGGFAAMGDASDLSATYRITRALYMLKAKPDVARLQDFIAKCRNEDGGYGVSPGKPSTASATYFAAIVHHWLDELSK